MGESGNIPRAAGADLACCEECRAGGADGVILRICARCGHVGCAEGSPSDHAAEHYAETDHPIATLIADRIAAERMSGWSYPDARPV